MFRRIFAPGTVARLTRARQMIVRNESSHSPDQGKVRTQEEISAWVESELKKGVRSCNCYPLIYDDSAYFTLKHMSTKVMSTNGRVVPVRLATLNQKSC